MSGWSLPPTLRGVHFAYKDPSAIWKPKTMSFASVLHGLRL